MDRQKEKKTDDVRKFNEDNSALLAATQFDRKGGWLLDTQFFLQMGSSYLLAHGMGRPVEDATASLDLKKGGDYNVFVRTRDWAARWSKGSSPGRFRVAVDDHELDTDFGGDRVFGWHWQPGGKVKLTAGKHRIAIRDLTGFDARCDYILFTKSDHAPDDSLETVFALRRELMGVPDEVQDAGKFDFVVVGGGMAGICAAIAAARLGTKVALIQDRKLLGGNNSSEIRVALGGRINIGPYPSLGYMLNEFAPRNKGNARPAHIYEDHRKLDAVLAEKNITPFLGRMMTAVEKSAPDTISAVVCTDLESYRRIRVSGRLFADCTGDATLGHMAGAKCHMGREDKKAYGEQSAQDVADDMTMGASVMWYCEEEDGPQEFPDIDWGLPIDEEIVQVVRRGQWYWEVGMWKDQIAEAEQIRDYGIYVALSNWSYLKNHYSRKEDYRNSKLAWLSYIAGKRESRRIIGEFVLREQDIKELAEYPDGTVSISWNIDHHFPDPDNEKRFPGESYLSNATLDPVEYYPIPYRCFYAKELKNMFMAGRNISVSHVALGTVRVMRTTSMIGEVVGMAASVCKKKKVFPADVGRKHFEELKKLMLRGVGRTDIPYTQIYTVIENDPGWREDN